MKPKSWFGCFGIAIRSWCLRLGLVDCLDATGQIKSIFVLGVFHA